VDLEIVNFRMSEKAFDNGLELAIGYVFLSDEPAAARISFEGAGAGAQFFRKASMLWIARAIFFMKVNWARLGKRFHAVETIVSEQDSARLSWSDKAQAVTAGGGVCSEFGVGRKSVDRRAHCGTSSFGDFCRDGYNPEGQHDFCILSSRVLSLS
jgi:hypothetical protein